MCKFLVLINFFLSVSFAINAHANLASFETDYCTMFVEGTKEKPELWKDCCIEHDLRYWFGGSLDDQNLADLRLKNCVESKGEKAWATIMYNAIRIGHYSPVKHKYQWSWGWINKRDKKSLSQEEKELVKSEIIKLDYSNDFLQKFIRENL
jgi:hypothetical protein